jgi:hypothetical protein
MGLRYAMASERLSVKVPVWCRMSLWGTLFVTNW